MAQLHLSSAIFWVGSWSNFCSCSCWLAVPSSASHYHPHIDSLGCQCPTSFLSAQVYTMYMWSRLYILGLVMHRGGILGNCCVVHSMCSKDHRDSCELPPRQHCACKLWCSLLQWRESTLFYFSILLVKYQSLSEFLLSCQVGDQLLSAGGLVLGRVESLLTQVIYLNIQYHLTVWKTFCMSRK